MKLQFQPDMPDQPNVQWERGAVIFYLHAKPIKFGPYPDIATAYEAFNGMIASTQLAEPKACLCLQCGAIHPSRSEGESTPYCPNCEPEQCDAEEAQRQAKPAGITIEVEPMTQEQINQCHRDECETFHNDTPFCPTCSSPLQHEDLMQSCKCIEHLLWRRAKLTERIKDLDGHLHWHQDGHPASRAARDLRDELRNELAALEGYSAQEALDQP